MGNQEAFGLLQGAVFRARTVGEATGEAGVLDVPIPGLGGASAAAVEEAGDWHGGAGGVLRKCFPEGCREGGSGSNRSSCSAKCNHQLPS